MSVKNNVNSSFNAILSLYKSSKQEKTLLPTTFQPHPSSVVIAKGAKARNMVGNQRLQALVQSQLDIYANATLRKIRTNIVSNILYAIQQSCPDDEAAFVKFDGQRWWVVDENVARHKISATFRDNLHNKYKSSTKNKVAKRRAQISKKPKKQAATNKRTKAQQEAAQQQPPAQEEYLSSSSPSSSIVVPMVSVPLSVAPESISSQVRPVSLSEEDSSSFSSTTAARISISSTCSSDPLENDQPKEEQVSHRELDIIPMPLPALETSLSLVVDMADMPFPPPPPSLEMSKSGCWFDVNDLEEEGIYLSPVDPTVFDL